MRLSELPVASHIGADLLPELGDRRNGEYADAKHRFLVLDLMRDRLPKVDLLFCRDCLVHLSYADIRLALGNVSRSDIPYLTATGTEIRRSLVLVLHDSTQPASSPASDWQPKGVCKQPFE